MAVDSIDARREELQVGGEYQTESDLREDIALDDLEHRIEEAKREVISTSSIKQEERDQGTANESRENLVQLINEAKSFRTTAEPHELADIDNQISILEEKLRVLDATIERSLDEEDDEKLLESTTVFDFGAALAQFLLEKDDEPDDLAEELAGLMAAIGSAVRTGVSKTFESDDGENIKSERSSVEIDPDDGDAQASQNASQDIVSNYCRVLNQTGGIADCVDSVDENGNRHVIAAIRVHNSYDGNIENLHQSALLAKDSDDVKLVNIAIGDVTEEARDQLDSNILARMGRSIVGAFSSVASTISDAIMGEEFIPEEQIEHEVEIPTEYENPVNEAMAALKGNQSAFAEMFNDETSPAQEAIAIPVAQVINENSPVVQASPINSEDINVELAEVSSVLEAQNVQAVEDTDNMEKSNLYRVMSQRTDSQSSAQR